MGRKSGGGMPSLPHVMHLSDMKMSLHTDQQTMILSELTTAKKKLEEENQHLRDELQDAEVIIRILKQKLQQQEKRACGGGGGGGGWLPSSAGNVHHRSVKRGKKKPRARRFAFNNPSAPGRKTFQNRSSTGTKETRSDGTPPTEMVIFPKNDAEYIIRQRQQQNERDPRAISCNRVRQLPVSQDQNQIRARSHALKVAEPEPIPNSIIDKLARTVINEYTSTDSPSDNGGEWYDDDGSEP